MSGLLIPIITNIKNPLISYVINKVYSTVCHQENIKCISYLGHRMFVCARCAGIYSGAFIVAIVELRFIFPELPLKLLFVSVTPLLIDVALTTTRTYEYSKILAFLTGIISGFVIYLFVIKELENFVINKQ